MPTSVQLPQIKTLGTVRDQVIQALNAAIERGDIKPGTQLPPERDLAQMLGVSRSATRDAIKTLAGAGVLEVRHGHGTFVAETPAEINPNRAPRGLHLDSTELIHLFELRPLLEGPSAEWAAQRVDDDHRRKLEEFLRVLENVDSMTPLATLAELDRRFHGLIAETTGNHALTVLTYDLLDLLSNARGFSLQLPGRALESVREHKLILRAILAQCAPEARAYMEAHIRSVDQSLRGALTSIGPSETLGSGDSMRRI